MVLTAAQVSNFFQYQMNLQVATIAHLANEGIEDVDDLDEFKKGTIEQIAANCRRLPGGGNPLVFSAKSLHRMIVACDLVRFYTMVGRTLHPDNLEWTPIIKNFEIQWKALKELKKAVMSRTLPHSQERA